MVIMFLGVVLVFLAAIRDPKGRTWLDYLWRFIIEQWSGTVFSSILIFIVVIVAIMYITRGPSKEDIKKKEESG